MASFLKNILGLSVIIAMLPTAANAQFARNNNAPIDATADDITNAAGLTVLKGQVDVRQGATRILADQMKIFGSSQGVAGSTGDISKIVATGNFYYLTPDQEVRGNGGVYVQATDTFTVTGDVILLQDENVVTGDKLVYNLKTEEARVVGTCKGRKCGTKGRVNILIKNQNGNTANGS